MKLRTWTRHVPYSGLVAETRSLRAGFALGFRYQLLQAQRIVLPQGEAHVPQQQQHELHVQWCERQQQPPEHVKQQQRVHHLEVVHVRQHGGQIRALFTCDGTVTLGLIETAHHRLQEMSTNLRDGKRTEFLHE